MTLIATSQLTIVVGLGVTGLSAARFLQRQGVRFVAMDSRGEPPGLSEFKAKFPDISLHLGALDETLLSQASEIILSPGISVKTPEIVAAITAGASVIGDVELFAREADKPIVAITGSNAKTTVTTLVGQMARDAGVSVGVGGNIGTPVLDLINDDIELYVLELSSFQLETTHTLKAKVASVLNITEDHMDRYDSLADYYRAKQRIYFGSENTVINRADVLTQPPLGQGVTCLSFGLDKPDRHGFGIIDRDGDSQLAHEFSPLMSVKDLKLRGSHNVANGLSALAIGFAAGLPLASMLSTLKQFEGLPHRCQWVATIAGVDYINDSKATNVGAALAAIHGFANREGSKNIILIAGGDGKGADFSPLKEAVQRSVSLLILMGRDADKIETAIGTSDKIAHVENLQQAVDLAKERVSENDTVLLSPACASFDMFSGYEDRGNQFIAAVKQVVA